MSDIINQSESANHIAERDQVIAYRDWCIKELDSQYQALHSVYTERCEQTALKKFVFDTFSLQCKEPCVQIWSLHRLPYQLKQRPHYVYIFAARCVCVCVCVCVCARACTMCTMCLVCASVASCPVCA